MTQEKVFGCHVIIPVTGGTVPWSFPCPWAGVGGEGSPRMSIGSSCPRPQQWAATYPSLCPLPVDLPSQGTENDSHLKVLRLHIVFI